ncbi:MAG TPA: hypothetical protein VHV80_03230 [Steroidobacteraceae bacterium]|jgi:hypothetical protein|nr:hypothetical protein [Steroidobacteraceae bacterium]
MQPTIVPIHATPLGVIPLPEASKWNAAVAEIVTRRAAAEVTRGSPGADPLVRIGTDDVLAWGEEPVRAMLAEILRGIAWMARSVNRFAPGEFESFALQARATYLIVNRDGALGARNHPMSAWTGVYCVEAPEPAAERTDSGRLRLYESRMYAMFADATTDTMALPYRPGHHGCQLAPGELAIFPGGAMYEIAPVRGAGRLLALTVQARCVAPGQKGVSGW